MMITFADEGYFKIVRMGEVHEEQIHRSHHFSFFSLQCERSGTNERV